MTRSNDIGKWLEDKTQAALKEIQSEHRAMWYRFPDSHAARNLLPAQPGDHLLAIGGIAILIEEKCSESHQTLRSGFAALWEKHQAAYHRKWHRADCPSWIIFCDYVGDRIEIWSGERVALRRCQGKKIPTVLQPIAQGKLGDLKCLILEAIDFEKRNRKVSG